MREQNILIKNVTIVDELGQMVQNQSVIVSGEYISFVGLLPNDINLENFNSIVEGYNRLLTPGLIDCHTHLVYGGNRANEFQMRLAGRSYTEIAANGGGIMSTVNATRMLSEDALFMQSLPRLFALIAQGVTTVEIKSGYGLDLQNELKILKVARRLATHSKVTIKTTFLGAHAVPTEYKERNCDYVDYLCSDMIPAVANSGLADAMDVFCESIGFNLQQTEKLFKTAVEHNLPIKCHAEQLSDIGASTLACKFKALSCDHLEFLSEKSIEAMVQSNTVAVLLPGAYYFLKEKQKPPVEALRKAKVPIAIATDCNPGTSPTTSLLLMMNMACQLFDMQVSEVICAVTSNAARALGIFNTHGALVAGKRADIVLWSIKDIAELCYYIGSPIAHQTMCAGQWINGELNENF